MATMTPRTVPDTSSYRERRDALATYFDRTALEAWKAFATDAPVGRIRETVRRGRTAMQELMLAQLPRDLTGWRVLDAGCGTGAMAAELASRGAAVVAVDLSAEQVRYARENWPAEVPMGRVTFASGDMLDEEHGRFDAVVAMDSLIHYRTPDMVGALVRLTARTERRIVLTHAPATAPLRAMHAAGKLFPRSNRSPAIVPVEPVRLRRSLDRAFRAAGEAGTLERAWAVGATRRVSSGFYTSQMLVLHSDRDGAR